MHLPLFQDFNVPASNHTAERFALPPNKQVRWLYSTLFNFSLQATEIVARETWPTEAWSVVTNSIQSSRRVTNNQKSLSYFNKTY